MTDYSEQKMKLRKDSLAILLKKFDDNRSIYECADDWVSKQVTTAGLIKYYEAYYSCLLYTSPSPRDKRQSRMPSSA